jgi:hypothetical protein
MKNTFLLFTAAMLTFASCTKTPVSDDLTTSAQRQGRGADDPIVAPPANLPAAVLSAFNTRYPNATRIEWEPENNNTWKAKFFIGTVRWKVFFKADGTFISASLA